MEPAEREARVVSLLEDNVRTELEIMDGPLKLGLSAESRENLMLAITSSILYAFNVDWDPDWVKAGEVHTWEDKGVWFARCPRCLQDSPMSGSKGDAVVWALDHAGSD